MSVWSRVPVLVVSLDKENEIPLLDLSSGLGPSPFLNFNFWGDFFLLPPYPPWTVISQTCPSPYSPVEMLKLPSFVPRMSHRHPSSWKKGRLEVLYECTFLTHSVCRPLQLFCVLGPGLLRILSKQYINYLRPFHCPKPFQLHFCRGGTSWFRPK